MGCWTAYLVRLDDGSHWESYEKYGRWHLADADDRADLVERVLADGRPIDGAPNTARACHGIALDLASRDHWFVGWDADARQITVRHDELIADALAHATCLVSVIGADATLTHWQLSDTIVPLLAHQGESLPGTLAAGAPFPLAAEDAVTDGAVIDLPTRRLRYWTADTVSPGLAARVEAAWPAWKVERLAWGHLGHLAAIGQQPDGLSMTDAELREARWDEELITIRNRARDTLPTEPRRLLPPRVRVVDRL
ncbi:hypothetical protein [Actinomadura oligospora]|uniref:hypothetical protein n=1 Tax=Actinomadura oligospora TaxID=111804 RepID=UPI0004AFFB0D|nr:hypothetical protein [Actinomadura oligospora]